MLQLKNISKTYHVGNEVVRALNDVSVDISPKQITAILGQSGCGKTTLLNIIGGLDHADEGTLTIDGISTKDYKPSDWDAYRNYHVGFVFQSYNLIPHMTVYKNIELALTLAGVDNKAKKTLVYGALEKVGLSNQAKKKPNQLSGGQMQRVAIARAIVNNPTILLADEPTASVDSETSLQIMEVLREISKEYSVIMVTHNQELASNYADRIITMKDGKITSDSPNTPLEYESADALQVVDDFVAPLNNVAVNSSKDTKPKKRTSMSFWTSLKLSLSNLINKKGRSLMTISAGSISIICLVLILAMNTGFSNYIYDYENDSLSKYPISITSSNSSFMDMMQEALKGDEIDMSSVDLNEMIGIFRQDEEVREKYTDAELVYMTKTILGVMENFAQGGMDSNPLDGSGVKLDSDISKFMSYLNEGFDTSWGTVRKDYDLSLNIYQRSKNGTYTRLNPFYDRMLSMMGAIGGGVDVEQQNELRAVMDTIGTWSMMVDDKAVLESQYDVLAGHIPDTSQEGGRDEIVLVVDEYNQIDDFVLFALNKLTFNDIVSVILGKSDQISTEYDFNEFIGQQFTLMISSDCYVYNDDSGLYEYTEKSTHLDEKGITLTIAGIVRLKENEGGGCISGSVGYTQALAEHIINTINSSDIVDAQKQEYAKYVDLQSQISALQKRMEEEELVAEDLTIEEQLLLAQAATLGIKSVVSGKNMTTTEYDQFMSVDLDVKDINKPEELFIYPASIEGKAEILQFLDDYNAMIDADAELSSSYTDYSIKYTDELSAITASMSSMVDTITYILIAVAAMAVVVAMLLVAIILYISVQDRTKEIGILRAVGASRGNVSSVFVAETFIVGLISGVLGVAFGLILMIPGNVIVQATLGISNIFQAVWWQEILLVGLCFFITIISGIIPAVIASRKDPVLALRTE